MSLDVKIKHLNQQVDFTTGDVANLISLELPNGALVTALVTDADAATIIAEVQRAQKVFKPPQQAAPSSAPVFTPRPKEAEPFVFGGDVDTEPALEEDEPIVGPQLGPSVSQRTVGSDEMGYPAVRPRPAPPAGPQNELEDGVASL